MRRRGLNENALSIERIARDAEAEGRHDDARRIRQEIPSYRKLKIQKRLDKGGKIKRYQNLATFNRECKTSAGGGMLCLLDNYRVLADGTAMATVNVRALTATNRSRNGTWLLHYASPTLLERDLRKRVGEPHGFRLRQKPKR